jgi:hypothetical protein
MLNQDYSKVVVYDVGIPEILENEPFVASKERDLIEALKRPCNHLLPDHSKRIVSHGCFMLHLGMVLINRLKLHSFHGIDLRILCKGNKSS